jgi:hypothetical protein
MKSNQLIKELFIEDPFDYEKTDTVTLEQIGAMATAYSNKGFRDYLKSKINEAIFNSSMNSVNMDEVNIRKGRILGLMMLQKSCREAWEKITHETVTKKVKEVKKEDKIKEF